MDLALRGRKALVTGASKGIGAEIARQLAEEGCDLVLAARTAADLENRARELHADTGRIVEVEAVDISDGDQVIALAQRHDDVDILINNAGALPGGHVLDIDETTWRQAWDLKVFGYINMCREFYRAFKVRGRGTIVNIIGVGAVMKFPWYMCGASGNAAVAAFTNALGGESHKDGIRVLGVSPGAVATERATQVLTQAGGTGGGQAMVQNVFGRDWATPAQIADVVVFMASDRASYVSGTVVNVDFGASRV
jgi:NAD(P)-dependent dehydrogenase (short-subunit alcohol dehydrogenase family)